MKLYIYNDSDIWPNVGVFKTDEEAIKWAQNATLCDYGKLYKVIRKDGQLIMKFVIVIDDHKPLSFKKPKPTILDWLAENGGI